MNDKMKKLLFIAFSLLCLCVASSCQKDQVTPISNPECITVYGSGYSADIETYFGPLAIIMADGTTLDIVSGLHPYFLGFRMLVSPNSSQLGGYMISESDCLAYIIAPATPVPVGWTEVADSNNKENPLQVTIAGETIQLKIFSCRAYAGKKVSIPTSNKAFCATPIARSLKYVELDK